MMNKIFKCQLFLWQSLVEVHLKLVIRILLLPEIHRLLLLLLRHSLVLFRVPVPDLALCLRLLHLQWPPRLAVLQFLVVFLHLHCQLVYPRCFLVVGVTVKPDLVDVCVKLVGRLISPRFQRFLHRRQIHRLLYYLKVVRGSCFFGIHRLQEGVSVLIFLQIVKNFLALGHLIVENELFGEGAFVGLLHFLFQESICFFGSRSFRPALIFLGVFNSSTGYPGHILGQKGGYFLVVELVGGVFVPFGDAFFEERVAFGEVVLDDGVLVVGEGELEVIEFGLVVGVLLVEEGVLEGPAVHPETFELLVLLNLFQYSIQNKHTKPASHQKLPDLSILPSSTFPICPSPPVPKRSPVSKQKQEQSLPLVLLPSPPHLLLLLLKEPLKVLFLHFPADVVPAFEGFAAGLFGEADSLVDFAFDFEVGAVEGDLAGDEFFVEVFVDDEVASVDDFVLLEDSAVVLAGKIKFQVFVHEGVVRNGRLEFRLELPLETTFVGCSHHYMKYYQLPIIQIIPIKSINRSLHPTPPSPLHSPSSHEFSPHKLQLFFFPERRRRGGRGGGKGGEKRSGGGRACYGEEGAERGEKKGQQILIVKGTKGNKKMKGIKYEPNHRVIILLVLKLVLIKHEQTSSQAQAHLRLPPPAREGALHRTRRLPPQPPPPQTPPQVQQGKTITLPQVLRVRLLPLQQQVQVRPRLPRTPQKQHRQLQVQNEGVRHILPGRTLLLRKQVQLSAHQEELLGLKQNLGLLQLPGTLPRQQQLIQTPKITLILSILLVKILFYHFSSIPYQQFTFPFSPASSFSPPDFSHSISNLIIRGF